MILRETFEGSDPPFEGDRTLWLRTLPAGASATAATLTLAPVAIAGVVNDLIHFSFGTVKPPDLSASAFGITRSAAAAFVEVDFHARRKLASAEGVTTGATLQVDVGGTYVEINEAGAVRTPGTNPFKVLADHSLPGLIASKFKLTAASGTVNVTRVSIRSLPSNVSVRLGAQPAFFTRVGELATPVNSPDFAAMLNVFLATATPVNGYYAIPFVIHTDTLARLTVDLALEFTVEQRVLPDHLPSVQLMYSFGTLPSVDEKLTTVSLPADAQPVAGRTTAQVRGQFQASRVAAGPIGDIPPSVPVVASPQCVLAQPLRSQTEIALTGVDLPLANTVPGLSGVNLAIRGDADGKPSEDVLATANVLVEKPLPGESPWGSATLPSAFRVLPGVRYWLVLQSLNGEANWSSTRDLEGEPPLQCSRDGGVSWRVATARDALGPLAALHRLRETPQHFTVPVQLQLGKGAVAVRRRLDEFAPLGRIEFAFDFADKLREHLGNLAAAQPGCSARELLANGSFDAPAHSDASRPVFGYDAAPSSQHLLSVVDLTQGVNLSVRRLLFPGVGTRPPFTVDCAGADPAHTTGQEIADAISAKSRLLQATFHGTLTVAGAGAAPPLVTLYPWRESGVPLGWRSPPARGGQVLRLKVPTAFPPDGGSDGGGTVALPPELLAAALGAAGPDPVILAQRVPAAAHCAFRFQLGFCLVPPFGPASVGLATSIGEDVSTFATPRWEIEWFDASGQSTGQDGADLDLSRQAFTTVDVRVVAPEATVEAELRFVQPPRGLLVLSGTSLTPTDQTLTNGTFSQWNPGDLRRPPTPLSWNVDSGQVEFLPPAGIRLVGRVNLPEDTVVSQVVDVVAGDRYDLVASAQVDPGSLPGAVGPVPAMLGPAAPVQQRPRLELVWLAGGPSAGPAASTAGQPAGPTAAAQPAANPVGEAVELALDAGPFATFAWSGLPPSGANQAQVRLVQPLGAGNLLVRGVSLVRTELTQVPLIFLAEAPGELTASALRVAYDRPGPIPDPSVLGVVAGLTGAAGLAIGRSTPAAPAPAGLVAEPSAVAAAAEVTAPQPPAAEPPAVEPSAEPPAAEPSAEPPAAEPSTRSPAAEPSARSPAAERSTRSPAAEASTTPPTADASTEIAGPSAEEEPIPTVSLRQLPLTAITGLGRRRASALEKAGIGSLEALASASPTAVARALRRLPSSMAVQFIEQARCLIEVGRPAPPTEAIQPAPPDQPAKPAEPAPPDPAQT